MSIDNRLIHDVQVFVAHNKVLCACTLGLAVLGYLGYRGVKWILEKAGIIERVNTVAIETISRATPKLRSEQKQIRGESKAVSDAAIHPLVENKGPQIIQPRQSVESFIRASYSGAATERNKKYSERIRNISKAFSKSDIYPVRGDGNCFTNSAAAGLLHVIGKNEEKRQETAQIITNYQTRDTPYILPDVTQTAPQYNKVFTKEGDFKAVLDRINGDTFEISELIGDQSFISAFSRVIRYILVCEREQGGFEEGDIPGRCGEEIDMEAVVLLNRLFRVNASLIVLQGPNQASDPENPHEALQLVGRERFEGQRIVDMSQIDSRVIEGEFDFLILRKSGHFLAML